MGTLTRVCSWCKKIMGTTETSGPDGTTHGICKECLNDAE